MSRVEYMNKLISALSGFDAGIRDEIINDYEDHFVNGLRSGKTEDEIAEELGSIDELVSDLNALCGKAEDGAAAGEAADAPAKEAADESGDGACGNEAADSTEEGGDENKSSFSEDASAKINEMIKNFATLIGEVAAGINKGSKKVSSTVGEGAKKVSSTVGEGAKKVSSSMGDQAKDLAEGAKEFANNFASGFMKGYESIAQGVGNMTDKVKNSDFVQEISESYRRSMNKPPKTEEESEDLDDFDLDDELNKAADNITKIFSDDNDTDFDTDETEEGFDEFEDDEEGEFVSFSGNVENIVIEAENADVYIDESEDDALNFNYENDGNPNQKLLYRFDVNQKGKTVYATVKKQNSLSNFFQTLGSPDISVYVGLNDSVKKVSVRTMSGEVGVDEADIEQLKVNTMSGDINVNDCSIITAELSTMSGDVDVTLDEGSVLSMSTISGDIDFQGTCESLHAKTTSGDVDFTIDNENSDVTVSSVSGDIDVELTNDNGFVANVKSTAGSITLSCGDDEKEVTRSGSYIMGDGGAKLSLSSISGDIDVNA